MTLATGRPLLGDGAEVLALPIAPGADGPLAGPGTAEVGKALGLDLAAFAAREKATGAVGDMVSVPIPSGTGPEQVLLVGVGAGGVTELRRAGAAVARRVRTRKTLSTTLGMSVTADGLRALVEGLALGSYSYGLRSGPQKPQAVGAVTLHVKGNERVVAAAGEALDRGRVTASAVCLARDLANTPSAKKTPAWLADQAAAMAKKSGLGVKVWDPQQLTREGFGGLLAVGGGAAPRRGPRLIQLTHTPTGATGPHIVLVGKGITFDSGGLSLKPNDGMVAMKADMAGGAAVIGAMSALRALQIPVRVTGLVAAAENMPSGSAYRPGDVIRHYGGRTVEVLNTDAEGRLVLADALAYADAKLNPDLVVDLATLTGAATLALTRRIGALFSNDERLATALLAAGDSSGDRLWRLPLTEDYRCALESPVADLAHVPRDRKVQGGAITAALFLREFAGPRRWAHIDMAGPGKIDADEHENTKGGTGYGVRLLLRWLESYRR
ncbi:MAG TPA: leucyl aminopeptidase [Sporichthyaceae bacterium]|nr:leucyl aminopeptidase [Sporichthyaceae bacterium]